jgi:hypothetical protein
VASLQQSCSFCLSVRGFAPNQALHRLTDANERSIREQKARSPEDAISASPREELSGPGDRVVVRRSAIRHCLPAWHRPLDARLLSGPGATLGRIEPRHADAGAAAGTTSAPYGKPTAPTTDPGDRSLSRGLHNATCLGSTRFEGSPRTWTSSVARVHRIDLPAIAITTTSLAAHDIGHRPSKFDMLIIAP